MMNFRFTNVWSRNFVAFFQILIKIAFCRQSLLFVWSFWRGNYLEMMETRELIMSFFNYWNDSLSNKLPIPLIIDTIRLLSPCSDEFLLPAYRVDIDHHSISAPRRWFGSGLNVNSNLWLIQNVKTSFHQKD